jgi:muramoyltetrapeptide carboxypeptidase LdcA involved in peptidoglycan recycling
MELSILLKEFIQGGHTMNNIGRLKVGDSIGIFSPSSPITYTCPKRFIRVYSDVTAILLAIYAKTGINTYYGPALVASFGELPPFVVN